MRVFSVSVFCAAVLGACAPDEVEVVFAEGEGEASEGEGEGEGEGEEGEGEGEGDGEGEGVDPEVPPEEDPPVIIPEDPPPPEEPPPEEPPPANTCPRVQVRDIGSDPLNVRPQPNRSQAPVGTLRSGEIVDVLSIVEDGEAINGVTRWFEIAKGSLSGYVSAVFADCTDVAPPVIEAPDGFLLPFECDSTVRVSQGNNSAFSHTGFAAFAFDFGVPRNTPLLASEDGVVELTRGDVDPGEPCYNGGGSSCANTVNYVVLDHGDNSATLYLHLEEPLVESGEIVRRGDVIALSGGTGFSSGPHLHIQRQALCGSWWCQSQALPFADVGHTPAAGETVVSHNCQE